MGDENYDRLYANRILPVPFGKFIYVSTTGSDGNRGATQRKPYRTVQAAVTAAASGDIIVVAPGSYDEAVTIPRTKSRLTIMSAGQRSSIEPSTTDASALTNHSDNLTLIKIGCAANGTGTGLVNTGSRLRAYDCKFENDDGTGLAVQMTLGTVAQITAASKGKGADCLFEDCEFAWAANGLKMTGTDYGAVTELFVRRSRFHNLGTAHVLESVGSGGSAAVTFASVEFSDCIFDRDEAGAEPTHYFLLNANNGNKGIVTRCSFPTAIGGGKNLVSTGMFWIGNYHIAGIGGAQPS